jgi:hypothetical protein
MEHQWSSVGGRASARTTHTTAIATTPVNGYIAKIKAARFGMPYTSATSNGVVKLVHICSRSAEPSLPGVVVWPPDRI